MSGVGCLATARLSASYRYKPCKGLARMAAYRVNAPMSQALLPPLFRAFPLVFLMACTSEVADLRDISLFPPAGPTQRGAVELIVKSEFPVILQEIDAGGGPALSSAMDRAGVPEADRPARLLQLRSDLPLYTESPAALVTALLTYGS